MAKQAKKEPKKVVSLSMSVAAAEALDSFSKEGGMPKNETLSKLILEGIGERGAEYEKPMIINVLGYKGGSGKTTTAVNLAVCLSELGGKVLLIDLDGQGNASQYLSVYDAEATAPCIADVLIKNTSRDGSEFKTLEDVIQHSEYSHVDVVPSHFGFASADRRMSNDFDVDTTERLKKAIEALETRYDYIIFDCAPNLDLVITNTITAMQAGNPNSCYVIPVKADGFSPAGLRETVNAITSKESRLGRDKHKINIVFTVAETRTTVYSYIRERIEEEFTSCELLETYIPKNIAVVESTIATTPLVHYARQKRNAAKKAYYDLAEEIKATNKLPKSIEDAYSLLDAVNGEEGEE